MCTEKTIFNFYLWINNVYLVKPKKTIQNQDYSIKVFRVAFNIMNTQ